jgi:hypothetical protein
MSRSAAVPLEHLPLVHHVQQYRLLRALQAGTNISIPVLSSDRATMRPVPYLLKLPAAAARLPRASLQALQRSSGSDIAVHWQQDLTVLDGWVAERVDIDLEAPGAVVQLPQQLPTSQDDHTAEGDSLMSRLAGYGCAMLDGSAALKMAVFLACREVGCVIQCPCAAITGPAVERLAPAASRSGASAAAITLRAAQGRQCRLHSAGTCFARALLHNRFVSLIMNISALLALKCIKVAEFTFCWQAHELLTAANVLVLGKLLLLWFCTRRRDVPG